MELKKKTKEKRKLETIHINIAYMLAAVQTIWE